MMTAAVDTLKTPLKNRYRILDKLSTGGFSETWLAEDTQMPSRRRCVIKQLKPTINHPEIYSKIQQRFQREAEILEKLGEKSDRIPKLYAYFEEAGQFYLVQEWIEGETLTERVLRRGILAEAEVKQILLNLLPVLDLVHQQGLIHRDIKPDNIILRKSGNLPVLIDFGAVKETMGLPPEQGGLPQSLLIGTPGFMPAEQVAGHSLYCSDLYSLGLTAIYLLTGKLTKDFTSDEETAALNWKKHAFLVSDSFARFLNKAIQFQPQDRYITAREMLSALPASEPIIAKTEPSLPPATVVFHRTLSSLKGQRSTPIKSWQQATMMGVIMGAILGLTFSLIPQRSSEATAKQQVSVAAQTFSSPETSLPLSFYFIADSAFISPQQAQKKQQDLIEAGYPQAGFFWGANYSNLSKDQFYKVYANWFKTKSECQQVLNLYRQYNPKSYCGFATKDVNSNFHR